MPLPTNAKARKDVPIYRGFVKYFPDAMAEVAELSRIGNEQHNPGQPLHWAKEKSTDEADALMRHQMEVGTRDTDGVRHATKVAWRAMAQLQRELDAEQDANQGFDKIDGRVDFAKGPDTSALILAANYRTLADWERAGQQELPAIPQTATQVNEEQEKKRLADYYDHMARTGLVPSSSQPISDERPISMREEREQSKARVNDALRAGEKRDPEANCGYATCAVCNTTGVGTATEAEVDQFMDILRGLFGDDIEVIQLA